jgi:EthD domain
LAEQALAAYHQPGTRQREYSAVRPTALDRCTGRSAQRAPYDGYAEAWYDDLAALQRMVTSPEWRIVQKDELNFLDTAKTLILFTEAKVTYDN